MKTCLICGYKAENEAFTCMHCGEASWGNPEPEEASPEDPSLVETQPDGKVVRRSRKPKADQ